MTSPEDFYNAARAEALMPDHVRAVRAGNTPPLCSACPEQPLAPRASLYPMFVQSNSRLD